MNLMPVRKTCNYEMWWMCKKKTQRKNKNKLRKRQCFNSIKLETDTESKNKLVNVHIWRRKKEEEIYILNTISITINFYIAVSQGRLEKYNSWEKKIYKKIQKGNIQKTVLNSNFVHKS